MNNTTILSGFALLFCLLFAHSAAAQINAGGQPLGLDKAFQEKYNNRTANSSYKVPAINLQKLKQEDESLLGGGRFAAPIEVDINLENTGEWIELENGARLWTLRLQSKEALGIFVAYDEFFLPFGARFYMYSEDGRQIKGAYTEKNNQPGGRFMTGMLRGETAVLEYYEPKSAKGQGIIQIGRIFHSYQAEQMAADDYPYKANGTLGFGDALSCHVNINCPDGDNWQDQKRGVVRILRVFEEGIGWCSGSLINNTNEDGKPYVLSAYHCWAGFTPEMDLWRVDFNLESPDCNNPATEPAYQSILGATYLSGREESDFLLLELSRSVPFSYNAYFNGWDRDSVNTPQSSAGIHHPRGDIRKISTENDPGIIWNSSIPWSNSVTTPANHHFRVEYDAGTFEDGSSGSPLFNQNSLIVGQLHGGGATCGNRRGFYGRLSMSWNQGPTVDSRLREWLDPAGTGVMTLGPYTPPPASTIAGVLATPNGAPMSGVVVYLGGDAIDSVMTASDGSYFFEVQAGGDYTLTPFKNTLAGNGVSTFDIVLTQKHILQVNSFTEAYQLLAADVNDSGTITTFDIVNMRKVILNVLNDFPGSNSWRFDPSVLSINDLGGDLPDQDFMGYKVGDVTGNANPNQ